jgi:hypothetical protein
LRTATREDRAISEDEKQELRRFWGRVVFALGMGAGMFPLAVPPLAISSLGEQTAKLEVVALTVFCVSVLPASVLAFWHRRGATVWLLLTGLLTATLVLAEQHALGARGTAPDYGSDYLFVFPLALGLFGIFSEWKGWPPLLPRRQKREP